MTATAAGSTGVSLSWGAATDNVGVTGYQVERCQGAGCSIFVQVGTPTGTTFADSGLTAGTSYSYRVRATDAAGNLGPYGNTASATTAQGGDGQLPSAPGTLTATAAGSTGVSLSWGAATDNVGVTGYQVERCQGAGCSTFVQVGTPTGTTFADSGLTAGTSYSYRVRATDAAGNLGPYGNTASATTQAAVGGLVAAYGFDEGTGTSVADASGNGHTGSVNGATWASAGKFGKALSFNGANAIVTIPDAADPAPVDEDDARGVGEPGDGDEHVARRDLQGKRQLLPGSDHDLGQQAGRRLDRRRQLCGGLRVDEADGEHVDAPGR